MALKFKGTITSTALAALTSDDVDQYDAYRVDTSGTMTYKYCSVKGSGTPTWTEYYPIHLIKDVIYVKIWETVDTPDATSNAAQFPELGLGCFAADATTGKFYAYDPSASDWVEWSSVTISL